MQQCLQGSLQREVERSVREETCCLEQGSLGLGPETQTSNPCVEDKTPDLVKVPSWKVDQTKRGSIYEASRLRFLRSIFPRSFLGSEATNSIQRGYLYIANLDLTKLLISSSRSELPL
jgi:hypothetical protein